MKTVTKTIVTNVKICIKIKFSIVPHKCKEAAKVTKKGTTRLLTVQDNAVTIVQKKVTNNNLLKKYYSKLFDVLHEAHGRWNRTLTEFSSQYKYAYVSRHAAKVLQ